MDKGKFENDGRFAMTFKGLKLFLIGLVVLIAGYVLLCGGGIKDPAVFNEDMFDFRRLVVAPIVMVCGIVIEIVAILGRRCDRDGDKGEANGK